MMTEIKNLKSKDQAFVLALTLLNKKKAVSYLKYLTKYREGKLAPVVEQLSQKLAKLEDSKGQLRKKLQEIQQEKHENLMYHAHSAWIGEVFRGESSQVLSLILRQFPRAQLGQLLKDLPKETRRDLRKVKTQEVSPRVEAYLKEKFESRFPSISEQLIQRDSFIHALSKLSAKQIQQFFHELGIHELTLALHQVNRSAIRAILTRLSLQDAKELKTRLKEPPLISTPRKKEAQYLILSLDLEKLNSEEIILEIGFGVFSKIFTKKDRDLAQYFIYRLHPGQGYLFKRYVEQSMHQNNEEKASEAKEELAKVYEQLFGSPRT